MKAKPQADGMPRVGFYLLQTAGLAHKLNTICRLVNKIYQSKLTALIRVPDDDTARQLDDLLWTYDQGGFVPHELAGRDPESEQAPVLITPDSECEYRRDVLISVLEQVPRDFDRFDRVAEVVGADDGERAKARERYRYYRDQGCQLETHDMA